MTHDQGGPPEGGGNGDEFARLLAEQGRRQFAPIRTGDRVAGTVVSITPASVLVDIGQRSEGVIAREGLPEEDLARLPVGARGEFLVTRISSGGIELSASLAARDLGLERLQEAHAAGVPVEARVTGENKGGFTVDLPGVRGFVPFSHMEVGPARPAAEYVGRTLRFRVLEVRGKDVVLSRSALLREEQERERREVLARLEVGQELETSVVKVERFGAFVDVGGGLHALVPTSEMAWSSASDVRDMLRPGFGVRVKIIALEREGARPKITVSMKQISRDPWLDAASQFAVQQVVKGRVTRLAPFGAFLEIAPGIEGLVHISELSSEKRVQSANEIVKIGEEREAVVVAVDTAQRRIGLSIAQVPDASIDPEAREKYMRPADEGSGGGALAEALRKALGNKKK